MAKLTKRAKAMQAKVDRQKAYPLADALAAVKGCATAKFDESIDVAVQLGVAPRKSAPGVRGAGGGCRGRGARWGPGTGAGRPTRRGRR